MRIRLQGPSYAASLLTELNRCRQSRRYCDVLLQVGNRTFAAHRAILACAGAYFCNLFARTPASSSTAFSLEFISPANFEKVLTFVYTGQLSIDLIDVGVLYELAERLGINELVRACHTTFPDLQASVSSNCKGSSPGHVTLMVAAAHTDAGVSAATAPSVCSSAASCSSLSSSVGRSAAPTPAASSPQSHTRPLRSSTETHTGELSLNLKAENIQSHISYGQIDVDHHLPGQHTPLTSGHASQNDAVLPLGPVLQLKTEQGLPKEEIGRDDEVIPESSVPMQSEPCSFPDSSAQLRTDACDHTSLSDEALENMQIAVVGGLVDVTRDNRLFIESVKGANGEDRDTPQESGVMDEPEDEQWRQLAGEIIELSDDDLDETEEDDDDDDLVCIENGEGANSSSQVTGSLFACKTCGVKIPPDPAAVRNHAESHLTETGQCRVCGALFSDQDARASHALSHVGVQLFTCAMCQLQFCSESKLLRHQRQAASTYTIPQTVLTSSNQGLTCELQCSVCSKTLSKDFQSVRDHALSHVSPQSLSCGVCHLPQLSMCSLLWHTLTHLCLPVFCCPHCAQCFVERSLLDRHMTTHAEEAAAKEKERSLLKAYSVRANGDEAGGVAGIEELHCFLCPQIFRSSSAFHSHLSVHTAEALANGSSVGRLGKRKADQTLNCSSASSSSLREVGGLQKMSNMGLGVGVGFSGFDKSFQGLSPNLPSGILINGSGGPDGGMATGARSKWYRCRYCGKCFAHSGEFTYHLRIHTGEKPYQCKVCLRFFRGRSTMICHLKTHAGALMYRCTICGLYFSTLKMVSSHMELHKDHLPPDFNIEQTFMYNDHSKEPLPTVDT